MVSGGGGVWSLLVAVVMVFLVVVVVFVGFTLLTLSLNTTVAFNVHTVMRDI